MKFHRHDSLDVLLPPVQRVYSDIGLVETRTVCKWVKTTHFGAHGFREFSRVFGAQSECLGLGFPLARKSMYI